MSTPESMSPQATAESTSGAEAPTERCGQCGAPAAPEQRYCLNCGFHRRNAPDPVARYLSDASVALARVTAADALIAQRRRSIRFGPRITAALVAIALLVGVLVGDAIGGGSTTAAKTRATGAKTPSASTQTSAVTTATGSNYVNQENNLPNSVTP